MTNRVEPFEFPLWPAESLPAIPEAESYWVRSDDPAKPNGAIQFVSRPTLRVYLPEGAMGRTPIVLICPGGAYARIAIDKEGIETAHWLNGHGIAAAILKYRMPRPEISGLEALPWPLADGFQAMRLIRAKAAEWKLDPRRLGLMGFSAGGHLASFVATETDQPATRPEFLILIYPVTALPEVHGTRQALLGAKAEDSDLIRQYSTQNRVSANVPPTFMVHAKDDASVPYQDTLAFQAALQTAGVACEVELFAEGGHAFGLEAEGEAAKWPARCETWLHQQGVL